MNNEIAKRRRVVNVIDLDEFLSRNLLTKDDFRQLEQVSKAPITINVNGRVLISRRAEREWLRDMEGRGSSRARRRINRRRR